MTRFIPAIFIGSCLAIFAFGCSGTRPTNIGVKDGKLLACPNSPNCVSSQIPPTDEKHSISPLVYQSKSEEAKKKLVEVIRSLPRTEIVTEKNDYIYAEFTSFTMRYVDDVEFFFAPDQKTIHVRSASRLGYSDMGVNRKRIETIRELFAK
ncbi:PF07386 family protein [Leptospira inadai serovar Lyme str. 10]|uniref:PF07386 family protein n=2 Tax=Leptospira inadai serovar Lyme TaxID=293084 RepID=V6HJ00_9LEPT|nr:DUF1499 domain-containing protein [Leptospira inadai]EQA36775.1 PF07386 family protein [Leptospira inadai serovar Lyme str. 10]PNV74639.1 DUF1499 domain-containing protein [Leptospira inadai serovar Lyme]